MSEGSLRSRAVGWVSGLGWARPALIGALGLLLLWLGYVAFDRLFLAPAKNKKAEGTIVVANEQSKAEQTITTATLETLQQREELRDGVRETVIRGKEKINVEARKPGNEAAVHDAGIDALCELHDSFCGDAGSAALQPIY
jgi:hypothetical protein